MSQQGGGLIIVAGPIHTLELARAAALLKAAGGDRDKLKRLLEENPELAKLKPILDLYPVVLQDIRLQKERNTAIPAGLNFVNATPEMEFLNLNEEDEKSTSTTRLLDAWKEFFRGTEAANPSNRLLRGFYGYYPVAEGQGHRHHRGDLQGRHQPGQDRAALPGHHAELRHRAGWSGSAPARRGGCGSTARSGTSVSGPSWCATPAPAAPARTTRRIIPRWATSSPPASS